MLNNILKVEKIPAKIGAEIEFDNVLLVADGGNIKFGTPLIEGGKVTAIVQAQARAKKVKIIKFKRRKHHRKQMGHRQYYTQVKITGIMAAGMEAKLQEEIKAETPTDTETEAPATDNATESQTNETPTVETPNPETTPSSSIK